MHLQEPKHVHPFFSKPPKGKAPETDTDDATTTLDDLNDDQENGETNTSPQSTKPRKKRARRTVRSEKQPSLDIFTRRPAIEANDKDAGANTGEMAGTSLEEDPNLDRRKRRKTASPDASEVASNPVQSASAMSSTLYQQLHAEAALTRTQEVIDHVMVDTLVASTPTDDVPVSSLLPVAEDTHEDAVPESSLPRAIDHGSRSQTPPNPIQHATTDHNNPPLECLDETTNNVTPKKQIKVTKTGKLVSSPPKPAPPPLTTPKKRGRPRKAAKKANLSATITVIRYGSDNDSRLAFGQKIEAILHGRKPSDKLAVKVPLKPAGPAKAPHPFFIGKASYNKPAAPENTDAERRPVTPRKSACTPGKLRAERRKEQEDDEDDSMPAFGMAVKASRSAKQLGLNEPLWPSKTTAHVRNLDSKDTMLLTTQSQARGMALHSAKLKSNIYTLPAEEEVITRLSREISETLKTRPKHNNLDFASPEDVRLPTRLLTTGIDIQHKVRAQIRAPLETLSDRLFAKTHPALTTLFDDIEHTLTPFDEGRCESQAWAQKYKPEKAAHVLQSGREASTLKDWLKSLTVMAVSAAQDTSKNNFPLESKKPPRKKRKTAEDDFIVFDDEAEDEEMIDLETATPRAYPSLRRPRWTRNKNVVLFSGPHGCGKSATVYAVAKELDFEVFELHSGVRRSGKDIQDKVGDMTANHLVNHQRGDMLVKTNIACTVAADDTDNEREKAFQKDLDSGRQGTMTSFFAARPSSNAKSAPKAKVQVAAKSPAKTRSIPAAQTMLPIAASRKSQKQSLILIEEADVLFEEDQNFWAHIIKLAAQSKRPIVITCNDELQIPTQALPIAAVLRLTSPPVDLATDYLVALAGREGHILHREAVTDLYQCKKHDLRASITELNFWCQMSVGDKKGGLEWMYQRWPPGKDVDSHGRLLRVASEDTYRSGMGWLSHNVFEAKSNVGFDKEADLLNEVWYDWGVSPSHWGPEDQTKHEPVVSENESRRSHLDELDRLVNFSDALSALDVYARIDLPSYDNIYDQPIDPTLPPMSEKERPSYTIDASLLQAHPQIDFLALDTALAIQTNVLLSRAYPDLIHHPSAPSRTTSPTKEQHYTTQILHHSTANAQPATLPRSTFSTALDTLATPPDPSFDARTNFNLNPSSFDRAFSLITLDLAPYVRSIVASEQVRELQRIRLGNLLSEGGLGRRGRTTRASRTAMEGGERAMKRRERWFTKELNFELVMKTAGSSWAGLGWKGEGEEEGSLTELGTQGSESLVGTQRNTEEAFDQEMIVDVEP